MWEKITGDSGCPDANVTSHRLRVPGGWIVRTVMSRYNAGVHVVQTFVTDPTHDWKLETAPTKL